MYSSDAIMIRADGSVLVGKEAIRKAISDEAPHWPEMTITSDSTRAVGSTAWDIGTTHAQGGAGGERVEHYLVVLRRGLRSWKINSLALVPETADSSPAVKVQPADQ
jgi:ketosteroid isomerase-like protein